MKKIIYTLLMILFPVLMYAQNFCFDVTHYGGVTDSYESISCGDMDGDGNLDLVISSWMANSIGIYKGGPTGIFTFSTNISAGNPRYAALKDVDGDTDLDIVITYNNSNMSTVKINSGFIFTMTTDYFYAGSAHNIVAGDFDLDGDNDYGAPGFGFETAINNGSGVFAAGPAYTPPVMDGYACATGDVNNDGKIDVVTAGGFYGPQLGLLLNTNTTPGVMSYTISTYTTGAFPQAATMGKFNADLFDDVIIANRNSNTVSVFLGSAVGTLTTGVQYAVGSSPNGLASGDFNMDGSLDIVVVNSGSSDLSILLGNGNGTFQTAINYPTKPSSNYVTVGDFNLDTRPDIAVTGSSSEDTLSVYLNLATSNLSAPTVTPAITYCQGSTASPLSATGTGLLWYMNTTAGGGSGTAFTPSTSTTGVTTYYVKSTTAYCSSPFSSIIVTVNPSPLVNAGTDTGYCIGESGVALNSSATGGTTFSYSWSPSTGLSSSTVSNPFANPSSATSYTLNVTNEFTCTGTDGILVSVDSGGDIYGVISVAATPVTSATVYLLKYDNDVRMDTVAFVPVTGAGSYTFTGIAPSSYVVVARADNGLYPNAEPTFYGNTMNWLTAQIEAIYCTSSSSLNIDCVEIAPTTGSGFISGTVREGNDYGKTDNVGDPIPGVDISLEQNPGGIIISVVTTDAQGIYNFTNVPYNNYNVRVNMPGTPHSSIHEINLTSAIASYTNADYIIDSNYVYKTGTVSIANNVVSKSAINLYPNPANNVIYIDIAAAVENDKIVIEVYNSIGEPIYTKVHETAKTVQVDCSNFAAGIYTVKLIDSTTVIDNKKLILVR